MEMTVIIQGDSEGYVTFECPFCGSEFKLQAGEYQDEEFPFEELFCPYCGLTRNKNDFLSRELNKALGKMAKSINRSNGIIKMKYRPLKKVTTKELRDKDTSEVEFSCICCNRHVKALYCAGSSKIFCPYCGVDI